MSITLFKVSSSILRYLLNALQQLGFLCAFFDMSWRVNTIGACCFLSNIFGVFISTLGGFPAEERPRSRNRLSKCRGEHRRCLLPHFRWRFHWNNGDESSFCSSGMVYSRWSPSHGATHQRWHLYPKWEKGGRQENEAKWACSSAPKGKGNSI